MTELQILRVVEAARAADVRLIRFEYCDVSGVARTKAIHVDQLEHKMLEGVGLTRAQMSINLLEEVVPIEGMEPVGEIRLVPDPATFTVLPWSPGSASVLCNQLDHDRADWGACPPSRTSTTSPLNRRAATFPTTLRVTPRSTAPSGTTTTPR